MKFVAFIWMPPRWVLHIGRGWVENFSLSASLFFYPSGFEQVDGLYLYTLLPYDGLASHLPLVDGNPISGGKPLVALDIIDSIPEVTKALGQVHLQQISQQILQVWAEVWWKANLWTVNALSVCVVKPIISYFMLCFFFFFLNRLQDSGLQLCVLAQACEWSYVWYGLQRHCAH